MDALKNISLLFEILTVLVSLFAVVYSFGVVWRVEKELDTAWKLFLAAVIFFVIGEIFSILDLGEKELMSLFSNISKTAFATLFLLGILETRDFIRKMDGEK